MNLAIRLMAILLMPSFVLAGELDAVIYWQRSVPLSTPVSGVIIKVDAQPGERVKKGQALFQLDDRARTAKVEALKAQLKRAENNRDESQRELERTQELFDRTLIAEHELQVAKIQADDGIAQYQTAKANLVRAEIELEHSVIRAPFDAWVTQRNVEVGQTIVSELQAEPLMILVDAHQMVARMQMKASELSGLSLGQKADVLVNKNKHSGRITFIGMAPVSGTTDSYAVDVEFNVDNQVYREGQTARVSF